MVSLQFLPQIQLDSDRIDISDCVKCSSVTFGSFSSFENQVNEKISSVWLNQNLGGVMIFFRFTSGVSYCTFIKFKCFETLLRGIRPLFPPLGPPVCMAQVESYLEILISTAIRY